MNKDFLINTLRTIVFFLCSFMFREIHNMSKIIAKLETNQQHYVQFKLDIKEDRNEKDNKISVLTEKVNNNIIRITILENKG